MQGAAAVEPASAVVSQLPGLHASCAVATRVQVRSLNYMRTKVKEPSEDCIYRWGWAAGWLASSCRRAVGWVGGWQAVAAGQWGWEADEQLLQGSRVCGSIFGLTCCGGYFLFPACRLLGVDVYHFDFKLYHIAQHVQVRPAAFVRVPFSATGKCGGNTASSSVAGGGGYVGLCGLGGRGQCSGGLAAACHHAALPACAAALHGWRSTSAELHPCLCPPRHPTCCSCLRHRCWARRRRRCRTTSSCRRC